MDITAWFTDPEKVGIVAILMAFIVLLVTEKLVSGAAYKRVVEERDRYLEQLLRSNELLARASQGAVRIATMVKDEVVQAQSQVVVTPPGKEVVIAGRRVVLLDDETSRG